MLPHENEMLITALLYISVCPKLPGSSKSSTESLFFAIPFAIIIVQVFKSLVNSLPASAPSFF